MAQIVPLRLVGAIVLGDSSHVVVEVSNWSIQTTPSDWIELVSTLEIDSSTPLGQECRQLLDDALDDVHESAAREAWSQLMRPTSIGSKLSALRPAFEVG